ncbi:cupin domain-containing protein [Hyphomonas sp.]|uniref:cupin domain-containing protein n=1 Tax=Hyphomonas sp. TaxID=87 RepID=UPI003F6E5D1B
MAQLEDGSFLYSFDDKPWHSFLGTPADKMKILHVDEDAQQVVFVQRFGPDTRHLKHTHHCTAIAYTLSGTWVYDDTRIGEGMLAYEPYSSTHTPMTTDGSTADVLVILTAINKDGRFLELHGDDGHSFEFNLETFKLMASMTPEAFLEYQRNEMTPVENR